MTESGMNQTAPLPKISALGLAGQGDLKAVGFGVACPFPRIKSVVPCNSLTGVSRYRVTLFAVVVQFLAVVTQPIVVGASTALVLGNILTRTTCAVVMVHAICGWLLVFIDGVERCCLGHRDCSFLSS